MPVRFPLISTLIKTVCMGYVRPRKLVMFPSSKGTFISGSFRPETGLSVITPVCHPIRATGRLSGAVPKPTHYLTGFHVLSVL